MMTMQSPNAAGTGLITLQGGPAWADACLALYRADAQTATHLAAARRALTKRMLGSPRCGLSCTVRVQPMTASTCGKHAPRMVPTSSCNRDSTCGINSLITFDRQHREVGITTHLSRTQTLTSPIVMQVPEGTVTLLSRTSQLGGEPPPDLL